ncbi:MAG: substrate-binding domain-containing protein [Rhodospirillaceae bacterium]|nr:substrate-binding domain-containing protein [Rhodospirillaceae bacterium]
MRQHGRIRGRVLRLFLASALALLLAAPGARAGDFITVASTTSTQNAGLFDHLLPLFEAESGIEVRVVAVGTGQALRLARNGDADLLLVHDKPSEEAFVAEGYGSQRFDLMHNDFVVVGPASDPAGIVGTGDAAAALAGIAAAKAPFVSRGDDSGTHRREQALWAAAGVDPTGASGTWYREAGQGMGATLNTATMMEAYTLADRGTWLAMRGRLDLRVVVEGDARLRNQYGVTLVSPERHPHVKAEPARRFAEWLLSPAGQAAIDGFAIDGERLFIPNAR